MTLDRMTAFGFEYRQTSGEMYVVFGDVDTPVRARVFLARGYAGTKHGRNNPAAQWEVGIGPIPRGRWLMGRPRDHARLGRYCIPLTPDLGTQVGNRAGFYIHGDSRRHPGDASRGCIILPLSVRELIERMNLVWEDLPLTVVE